MSVTRPALSAARRLPGTSLSTRSAAAASRTALRCRVASSCAYSTRSAPCRAANSATAPFSATIASIGHSCAKPRLQPIGRPVTATTGIAASRRACSAASASGSIAPSRVRVSSMSVRTPRTARAAARGSCSSGSGRDAFMGEESCTSPATGTTGAGLATIQPQFRGALQGRPVPGSKLFIATALTRTKAPWVSPAPPACLARVLRDSGARP